jgi:MFS family permease
MNPTTASPLPTGAPRPWWETRAFVAAMVLLAAVPLLYPPVPPLVDLLGHMGRYRVQLDLGTSPSLHQYYDFQWSLMGNLGVDLLVAGLAPLLGLEPAVKLIVIAIPMLTVAGMLWVAREVHNRLPPTVMFALPFAYGHHFLFGFVNFSLSVALALLAFALWLRLGRHRRYRLRALLFVPISLIIWLCHAFGWGMLGLLALSAEVVRNHDDGRGWWRSILRAGLHVAVLALPLLLMLAWREKSGGATTDWFNWTNKLYSLRSVLRDRWRVFDLISFVLPMVVLIFAIVHPRLTLSRMLSFTALVLTVTFAMLPRIIFGSAYADMRLVPFLFVFALLAIRFRGAPDRGIGRVLALAALAFLLARTASVTASLVIASDEHRRYLEALDKVPMGARVLSLTGISCDERAWPMWRNGHIGGMVIVRRHGLVNNHWENPGAKLLTNIYAPAGNFRYDPSQLVRDPLCPVLHAHPVGQQLRGFPRAAFDYVWIVDPPPFDETLLDDAELIHNAPGVLLYRVRRDSSVGARPPG